MRLRLVLSIVSLAFSLALLSHCDTGTSPTSGGTGPIGDGNYYVAFDLDGDSVTIDSVVTASVSDSASSPTGAGNIFVMAADGLQSLTSGHSATIFVPGLFPRLYPNTPITYIVTVNGNQQVLSSLRLSDSSVQTSVTLTKVGAPLGSIEGTFDGTLYDSLGGAHVVTNGRFRVMRPQGTSNVSTNDYATVSFKGDLYSWQEGAGHTDVISATLAAGKTFISATRLGTGAPYPLLQIVLPDTNSGFWSDTTVMVVLQLNLIEAWATGEFKWEPIKSIDQSRNPPDTTYGNDSTAVVVSMHVTRVGEVFNGSFSGSLGRDNPDNESHSHHIFPPEQNAVTGNFKVTILRSGL